VAFFAGASTLAAGVGRRMPAHHTLASTDHLLPSTHAYARLAGRSSSTAFSAPGITHRLPALSRLCAGRDAGTLQTLSARLSRRVLAYNAAAGRRLCSYRLFACRLAYFPLDAAQTVARLLRACGGIVCAL